MIPGLHRYIYNAVLLKGKSGGAGGGGGGSAATASGSAATNKAVFGSSDHDIDFNAEEYAKVVGVTVAEAEARFKAVNDYSGNAYDPIRKAQRDGIVSGQTAKKAERIEQYLASAKKYDGQVYRGIKVASVDAFLKRYGDVGSTFTEKSMNSWSSAYAVAEKFSFPKRGRPVSVRFTVTNKTGASIKNISNHKAESEVLVGKNAQYRVAAIQTRSQKTPGGYTQTILDVKVEQL